MWSQSCRFTQNGLADSTLRNCSWRCAFTCCRLLVNKLLLFVVAFKLNINLQFISYKIIYIKLANAQPYAIDQVPLLVDQPLHPPRCHSQMAARVSAMSGRLQHTATLRTLATRLRILRKRKRNQGQSCLSSDAPVESLVLLWVLSMRDDPWRLVEALRSQTFQWGLKYVASRSGFVLPCGHGASESCRM